LSGQPREVAVALIVAVASNGVIGEGGGLPWRLSSDLKLFRRLTMGKPIVMGRRTFESLGRPLDGRDNIVVTGRDWFQPDSVLVARDIQTAMAVAIDCARSRQADEIMIIGGAQLYKSTLGDADRVYWTAVDAAPDGDTFMEPLSPDVWSLVRTEQIPQTERDEHGSVLRVYERRRLLPRHPG